MNASNKEKKKEIPVSSLEAETASNLSILAEEYTSLSETAGVVKSRQDQLRVEIAALLDAAKVYGISIISKNLWKINPIVRTTSKLDTQLLLANGVGMEIIEACTIVSQSRSFEIRNLSETKAAKEARQAAALEGRPLFPHQMDDDFDPKGDA